MFVSIYICTGTIEVNYLGEAGKTFLRDTVECGIEILNLAVSFLVPGELELHHCRTV